MRVELLAYTPNPDKLAAAAAHGCADPRPSYELLEKMKHATAERILDIVISSGHHSVVEHSSFTFSIEGVSRSLTHQLVRHRLASFSQQSQRYIRFDKPDMVTPATIEKDEKSKAQFQSAMEKSWEVYNELVKSGIPEEDARYVLPNAAKNNITVTMNARELLHFFSLRCCSRAQWEIRELAEKMLEKVKDLGPKIFENAGASCVFLGYCPETDGCGRAPPLKELMKAYENKMKNDTED